MDEHPTAEQVEAMKDDPDAWGEVEQAPKQRRSSERRQRGVVVSTRLAGDELEEIARVAEACSESVSGYIRGAALRESLAARPGARRVRSANGGEIVFWTNRPDLVSVA